MSYEFLKVERVDDGAIAIVTLDRPDVRNAQNRGMLVELDRAMGECEADDAVRVVILRGAGKAFSSGHDMGSAMAMSERQPGPDQHASFQGYGATRSGAEQRTLQEWHFFFNNVRRWRDLRKITIAAVHGPVYTGALILAWCCDLIVAQQGTVFADVVGTRMGMCGAEYFGHPWEFGPRRTKELMLTGDSITAEEAHALGMVSKIFAPDVFEAKTLEFARRVAQTPTMAALMIKESVNQTMDIMGFSNALNASFSLHQLNHSHWAQINEDKVAIAKPGEGVPATSSPVQPRRRGDEVE
jgi:enoyl-CoA hydratase